MILNFDADDKILRPRQQCFAAEAMLEANKGEAESEEKNCSFYDSSHLFINYFTLYRRLKHRLVPDKNT